MGNAQSSSTKFIEIDSLPVAESFKPCHIFGDPDLFGFGIRYSFYLQYSAAVLAIMFGEGKDYRIWRTSFVAVAGATFISLCVNATGDNLLILDWAIMIQLVFFFPVFLAFPILIGTAIEHSHETERTSLDEIRAEIANIREDDTTHRDLLVQRAFANLLNVRSQLVEYHEPRVVEEAINSYVQSFGPVDGTSSRHAQARAYLEGAYPDEQRQEIGRNFPLALEALDEVRERHIAAIQQFGLSLEQATETANRVIRLTKWERRAHNRRRELSAVLIRVRELGLVDKVTAGFSLLIYTAYCGFLPWLYFVGIDRGRKQGCDVRLLFLFKPISVYNRGFVIFLRVMACLLVIFALFFLFISFLLLAIGLLDGIHKAIEKAREEFRHLHQPADGGGQTGTNGDGGNAGQTQAIISLGGQNHPPQPPAPPQLASDAPTLAQILATEAKVDVWFPRIPFGISMLVFLAITWTLVEVTLDVNDVDMSRKPLTSTGELIAFIIGVVTFVTIAYNCAKLWQTRRSESKRRPSQGVVVPSWVTTTRARLNSWLDRAWCGMIWTGPDGTGGNEGGNDRDVMTEAGDELLAGRPPEMEEQRRVAGLVQQQPQMPAITGPRVQEVDDGDN
ncbi:hypothetical protein QBC43DRAFT_362962 [Cladorrhinum sp. PSN259]|nr:hypothetical protein QBC43DRAFT_362962 [Cladorrhinum sp. PSN259]